MSKFKSKPIRIYSLQKSILTFIFLIPFGIFIKTEIIQNNLFSYINLLIYITIIYIETRWAIRFWRWRNAYRNWWESLPAMRQENEIDPFTQKLFLLNLIFIRLLLYPFIFLELLFMLYYY